MTRKEYQNWLDELSQSSDPDVQGLARYAKTRNWKLSSFFPVSGKSLDEVSKSFTSYDLHEFYETDEDFQEAVRKTWFTFHGHLCAEWEDSI